MASICSEVARETDVPLMQALSQLGYWSAKHLGDTGLKAMLVRVRIQEGMVADVTILDPETVTENATYEGGAIGLPSTGIPHVLVSGVIVVKESRVFPTSFPVSLSGSRRRKRDAM